MPRRRLPPPSGRPSGSSCGICSRVRPRAGKCCSGRRPQRIEVGVVQVDAQGNRFADPVLDTALVPSLVALGPDPCFGSQFRHPQGSKGLPLSLNAHLQALYGRCLGARITWKGALNFLYLTASRPWSSSTTSGRSAWSSPFRSASSGTTAAASTPGTIATVVWRFVLGSPWQLSPALFGVAVAAVALLIALPATSRWAPRALFEPKDRVYQTP